MNRGKRRLVVVSNRVSVTSDAARSGGLAVALSELLKHTGGVWFGWSGNTVEQPTHQIHTKEQGGLTVVTLDLSRDEYDQYYSGFSNRELWPLVHYRIDVAKFDRKQFDGYQRVNARFAQAIAPMLREDDLVWVHDYHLFSFGEELRRMDISTPLGFFLHVPFPAREVLQTLPVHAQLVRALFAYDVVGFQTEGDRQCFVHYVVHEAGGADLGDGRVQAFGRIVIAKAFPIGIDAENFLALASSEEAMTHREQFGSVMRNRQAIIGVDRLDYTKGIAARFRAFERLLSQYPENHGKVTYVQIAPTTRADVPKYADIREELEFIAGGINGEYSEFDWTPLRYINRSYSRPALAGIFQLSRVGLVTPLRDGMNLVAKEFIAAQPPQDPGVLVLSCFAGAARQLTSAVIVNPYDEQEMAEAMQTALNMSLEERVERWEQAIVNVRERDVMGWCEDFLAALRRVRVASDAVDA